ncbi:MAG: hypothetical protein ACR2GN_05360, partial [Bacteroidia bacterium]
MQSREAALLETLISKASLKKNLVNRTASEKELQKLMGTFYEEGHLSASIDSVHFDSTSTTAIVFVGEKYNMARLNRGNVPEHVLSEVGYRERLY